MTTPSPFPLCPHDFPLGLCPYCAEAELVRLRLDLDRVTKERDEARFALEIVATKRSQEAEVRIAELEREVARLKRGDFTPEELQELCHQLTTDDACAFAKGCQEYQIKLFGVAKMREALAKVRLEYRQPGNGLANVIGKWPGDETDEEINKALKEMS